MTLSGKNQYVSTFNWQTTSPIVGFLPTHPPGGSTPSGTIAGAVTGTGIIYSNIIDVAKMDNIGIGMVYTGTSTGTLSIMVSSDGANFFALSGFNPPITQPSGAALVTGVSIQPMPYRYLMLQYTNTSGTGTIAATAQLKDLN